MSPAVATTEGWVARAAPDDAAGQILDAAGRCFARAGVGAVTIAHVAAEAGCSRPTVYRYFADRDSLRLAFVEREARHLGRDVARRVARVRDPRARLVAAVQAALTGVRSDPVLRAWFTPAEAGTAWTVAAGSAEVARVARSLLPESAADDGAAARRGAWLVRVIVSLLTSPAASEREERRLLEEFVVPVVLP